MKLNLLFTNRSNKEECYNQLFHSYELFFAVQYIQINLKLLHYWLFHLFFDYAINFDAKIYILRGVQILI